MANLDTADVWIQETVTDLESLAEDARESIGHITPDIVEQNWKNLIQYQKEVQAQMKRKSERMRTGFTGLSPTSHGVKVSIFRSIVALIAVLFAIGVAILLQSLFEKVFVTSSYTYVSFHYYR